MTIPPYPSIYALGHRAIKDIFAGPVIIEEKIDGSQFSFGVIGGKLHCRSKGATIHVDAPEKMFGHAVETAKNLSSQVTPEWIYRCEYLQKPKHNTLAYERVPKSHLIVFDVETGPSCFLPYQDKVEHANAIRLETVPLVHYGLLSNPDQFQSLLETESILGGCKIEGVVVKNYSIFTPSKHIAIAKYVSEAFKEKHSTSWKNRNPGRQDIVQNLIAMYRVNARWQKAVQHLQERGELTDSPKDIGSLIKEVNLDILKEEEDAIKGTFFKHFWPQIARGVTSGLAEWYKQKLAEQAFEKTEA